MIIYPASEKTDNILPMKDKPDIIRDAIDSRMKELGWNTARLTEALKGKAGRSSVYDFISRRADIGTSGLAEILKVLKLEVK